MPGSALNIKKKTSCVKSKTLGKRIRDTKSSKKSPQELISSAGNLTPFWTESSLEISKKLPYHTVTDCQGLDLTLLPKFVTNLTQGSWYRTETKIPTKSETYKTTCLPLSQCLSRSITEGVESSNAESEKQPKKRVKITPSEDVVKKEKKPPAGKAIKIRLYPNAEQRSKLAGWFGTVRWTYNQVVDEIEINKTPRNKKALRAKCINNTLFKEKDRKWVLLTPYDMRDEGMNDVLKAYDANFVKRQNTNGIFKIHHRSKKAPQEAIVIHSKYWSCKSGMYAFLHDILASEPLPNDLKYDSRLIRTRLGAYSICIPKPLEKKDESQVHSCTQEQEAEGSDVISLDPGVRTFQTCFSADGTVTEWGKGDMSRIYRLCHAYDDLQSRWTNSEVSNGMCKKCREKKRRNIEHVHCAKCEVHKDVKINHKKRYRMRKAGRRILQGVRYLISELHKKMVRWLCVHYKVILLPEFETSKMLRRGQRRINSKTARGMATWSHYRFKQRLLHKSQEYPECRVYIVGEAYTSKTCGHCGFIHNQLGGSKIFECPACKWKIDRDINGARNILIKFLTENMSDDFLQETSR